MLLGPMIFDAGREHYNWRMLRKLMMDPYLEKTSLKGGKFVVVRNGEAGVSWDAEGCKDMSYLLEKHEVEQDETSIKAT
jgi:hypothetical protein